MGQHTRQHHRPHFPRLGELVARQPQAPNASICDGYGVQRHNVVTPCKECPGDPFRQAIWPVLLCAPTPLAAVAPPLGSSASGFVSVLLVSSEHNNHGLFAQVERVLNQLLLAENLGLPAIVYLGRKVAAAPWTCDVGENQYFDAAHGPNVWEYFFEPVSSFSMGSPTFNGRPVRLLLASAADARRHAIAVNRDAVTSYFEFKRYDASLHEIRTRVRRLGARLVSRWVRVKPGIRATAFDLLSAWRQRSTHLLGVHLRGTDKVTHPKVPLPRFLTPIDAYLEAHPGALIVLATDDAKYHKALTDRYGNRILSASSGYATANIVRDPSIPKHAKGRSALLDALLLAHTDFLLKATSSLSEFVLWYNPALISRHLDLQLESDAIRSPTYQRLLPKWLGGTFELPALAPHEQPAATLAALGRDLDEEAGRSRVVGMVAATPMVVPSSAATVDRMGRGWQLGGRGRRRDRRWQALRRGLRDEGGVVPSWPLPDTDARSSGAAKVRIPVVPIHDGSCAGRGLQLLGEADCESLATQLPGHTFIGRTREVDEFPGCVRWGGGFLEFNAHTLQQADCRISGDTKKGIEPACLCRKARVP